MHIRVIPIVIGAVATVAVLGAVGVATNLIPLGKNQTFPDAMS